MSSLLVAPCKLDAAKYAVKHWHYSGKMPAGKMIKLGVWEHDRFIGVVIFSRGAVQRIGVRWKLPQTECCELTRVALTRHDAPVSQIVAEALRYLKAANPGMRLVISFADTTHGHHGGIYQAGNWIYTGQSMPQREFVVNGKQMHARSVHAKKWLQNVEWLREHVDPDAHAVTCPGKHRYLMPLDKSTRRRVSRASLPYPPAGEVSTVKRDAIQRRETGSSPVAGSQ